MKRSSLKDYKTLLVTHISLLAITGIGFIDDAIWNIVFARKIENADPELMEKLRKVLMDSDDQDQSIIR